MTVSMRLWTGKPSVVVYVAFLLLALSPTFVSVASNQTCALYDSPTPGIHCFHGNKVLETITNSQWAWMVELYSSWCGHCQRFAPKLKELAAELEAWSDVFRVGVFECTGPKENVNICSQFGVQGYPTIRVRW